jgi:hypothetical protein
MTSMTRGLSAPRRAVVAAATRGVVADCVAKIASVGRPARIADQGERIALARDHAWVEVAAIAALRARA